MSDYQENVLENQVDDNHLHSYPIFQEKQHKHVLDQAIDKLYDQI